MGSFSESIGTANIQIRASTDKFKKDMNTVVGETKKASARMAQSFRNAGAKMSLFITAPLALFARSAFKTAASAQEMQSKFNTVFGSMSDQVEDWATTLGKNVRRSRIELKGFAADTQGMLVSSGMNRKEAASLSTSFVKLAIDVASFNDKLDSDVVMAFQGALNGEREQLKLLSLYFSEATLNQELFNMGIKKGAKAATQAQKATATFNILMRKSGDIIGDAAKTKDSAANSVKAFGAAITDLKKVIGDELLPVLTPIINALTTWVQKFSDLDPVTRKVVVGLGLFAAALGPLVLGLGLVLTALNPISLAIAALATAVAGVLLVWKNWDQIGPIVKDVYLQVKKWLLDKLTSVFDSVGKKVDEVTGYFYDMWDAVVGHSYVPDMVETIGTEFDKLQDLMVKPAQEATEKVKNVFEGLASNIDGTIKDALDNAIDAGNFRSFGLDIGKSLLKSASGVLTSGISSFAMSGINSLFPSAAGATLGSLFGGFFAEGGSPPVGKPSIVGEKGPEMFIPKSSGTVVPNSALGGGGGNVTVIQNNNFQGVDSVNRQELGRALNIMGKQVEQNVIANARNGGRLSRNLRGAS